MTIEPLDFGLPKWWHAERVGETVLYLAPSGRWLGQVPDDDPGGPVDLSHERRVQFVHSCTQSDFGPYYEVHRVYDDGTTEQVVRERSRETARARLQSLLDCYPRDLDRQPPTL